MSELIHIVRFSRRYATLLLAVGLFCLCTSCSRVQSIRDARTIVATADSLRSAGISLSPSTSLLPPPLSRGGREGSSPLTSSDSIMLAEAVSALEPVRFFYPTAYAHANYYYGRLLREAGNHPEAMLAFLRVIHSRTKDYAIKGRAYSNIGTMCHLTDDHGLAYDMYSLSANQFLMNDDSLLYFYSLNNMAYELAEQGDKSGVYDLLAKVESQCLNEDVLTKVIETKAEACIKVNENDSALYYSIMLWERGNHEPTGLLIRAQAYDNLGEKDSALLYANLLLESSDFYGDRFNALYILTHNDTTINVEEVLSLTSDRTDIQMDYTEVRATLSQATQLLEQDLSHKPSLTWLWTLLATLCVITTSIFIYVRKKKSKHQLISQQTEQLLQKNKTLVHQTTLLEQQHTLRKEKMRQELEMARLAICNSHDWQKELHWKNYAEMCETLNEHFLLFANKLKTTTWLDEKEFRLCVLVFLDIFTLKQMATILSYSEKGIRTYKSRVNEKFGNKGHDLRKFLIENVILGTSDEQGM